MEEDYGLLWHHNAEVGLTVEIQQKKQLACNRALEIVAHMIIFQVNTKVESASLKYIKQVLMQSYIFTNYINLFLLFLTSA